MCLVNNYLEITVCSCELSSDSDLSDFAANDILLMRGSVTSIESGKRIFQSCRRLI